MFPVALTIAGSDPSGGAGIQADLKTFHQHATYGMSVITLITVQNTQTVSAVEILSADLVSEQLKAVITDIPPLAAKTGALGNQEVIEAIAKLAPSFDFPLIIDPVMISKHNSLLMEPIALKTFKEKLIPFSYLITPNIPEAEHLAGIKIQNVADMEKAAKAIALLGCKNVLIKGGHLTTEPIDVLYHNREIFHFPVLRIQTNNTHGTGCVLSAAICANLTYQKDLMTSVKLAKEFVYRAIESNPKLGKGFGPINMHVMPELLTQRLPH